MKRDETADSTHASGEDKSLFTGKLVKSGLDHILESMKSLIKPVPPEFVFKHLFSVIKELFDNTSGLLLEKRQEDSYEIFATDNEGFTNIHFLESEFICVAEASEIVNLNELNNPDVWSSLPPSIRNSSSSILLSKIVRDDSESILMLLHSEQNHFTNDHVNVLGCLIPAIEQYFQRLSVEKQIRKSEERYKLLIQSQGEGAVIINFDYIFSFSNNAANKIFGIFPDSLEGKNFTDYFSPDTKNIVEKQRVIRAGGSSSTYQLPIMRHDGEVRQLQVTANPFRDPHGKIDATFAIFRDITEQNRAQELLKSRLDFETVIATIASEFISQEKFDQTIYRALQMLGEIRNACRSYIFRFDEDFKEMSNTHEWCAEGIKSELINLQNLPTDLFPWWMEQLQRGATVNIPDMTKLPKEARAERLILEPQGVKSLIVLPYYVDHKLGGCIGFDNTKRTHAWTSEDIVLLQTAASIIGNAFEKKSSHDRIKESEEKYRLLVERASEGIVIVQNGVIRYANPFIMKLAECDENDIVGKHFTEFISKSLKAKSELVNGLRFVVNESERVFEIDLLSKNKREVRAEINMSSITYSGKPAQMVIIRDISLRYSTEKNLRDNEERFRTIATVASDAIIVVDKNGIMNYINPSALNLFGYSESELMGKPFEMIVDSNTIPEHAIDAFRQCVSVEGMGTSSSSLEINCKTKDDRTIALEVSMSSFTVKNEPNVLAIMRNISERLRMQAQQQHSQKMESIGTLAAGIAHEINTPTQYVGGNLEFLESAFSEVLAVNNQIRNLLDHFSGENAEDLKQKIDEIFQEGDLEFMAEEIPHAIAEGREGVSRVTKIVSAMKEFAHPGKQQKSAIDLNAAIESTITVSRNEWKYVSDLDTDLDSGLPLVPCIKDEFNQVILNLIVNASHAIGDVIKGKQNTKGMIKISTSLEDEQFAVVKIADTGGGIPEHIRDRIFDPFFTTKEVGKGTGQGLAIAHAAIIEKHNGSLEFETVMGEGTTFIIKLPIKNGAPINDE